MLLCALLPLLLGASVGPEAGLTGIIAALCYWVGDNVTLGAGSVLMTKPKDGFTYIGVPAKKFDFE